MGLFSWFKNLGKEKISTAAITQSLIRLSGGFRQLRDINRHPLAEEFFKTLLDTNTYNERTQPEFFHWYNTAMGWFGDRGAPHIKEFENKFGKCAWIPYSCDRIANEIDMIVKDIKIIFPENETVIEDFNETQSITGAILMALYGHDDDLSCGSNLLVALSSNDRNSIAYNYKRWRNIPKRSAYAILYQWPLHNSKYRLIDYILDRGPFASSSNRRIAPPTTRLSDIESNLEVFSKWKESERGSEIVTGFLPHLGLFIGDTLNMMAYKKNEYRKTQMEWLRCKLEQLSLKKQGSTNADKIAHLQRLIDKYAEEMKRLQTEIDNYQNYKGD